MDRSTEATGGAVLSGVTPPGKYLTFKLGEEEYGIGILKTKEIIGLMPVTSVPGTSEFVKGVINLRGKVIPVIDLRLRFGIPPADYNDKTCIIVVEVESDGDILMIGIVVDTVSEVLGIREEDIEAPPVFGTPLDTHYIQGMAKMEGGIKILLNIDKVLSRSEMLRLEHLS